ncbi:MAG: hypothetical protein QM755_02685 [Luteolibacter sp.]
MPIRWGRRQGSSATGYHLMPLRGEERIVTFSPEDLAFYAAREVATKLLLGVRLAEVFGEGDGVDCIGVFSAREGGPSRYFAARPHRALLQRS